MKHKGLIALAAIFAAGIVLTTFTSRMLGVEKPVENTVMTNAAAAPEMEGAPMAGLAAAQAAMDEDSASKKQEAAAEEAGVAAYGLDAGESGVPGPGETPGNDTASRKMAQDEAAQPEMAMAEVKSADEEAGINAYSLEDGNKEKQISGNTEESVSISPLDPEPVLNSGSDGANSEMESTDGTENSSYYRNRLAELENRIQKNREAQTASNNSNSAKTLADSELKLWDNELNLIYNAIKDDLDDGEAADLVEEERTWIRERDRKAVDAAKASAGGSLESVEYTASLADSTRDRAYELLDRYEDRIQ